jgi:hypothetical protein
MHIVIQITTITTTIIIIIMIILLSRVITFPGGPVFADVNAVSWVVG